MKAKRDRRTKRQRQIESDIKVAVALIGFSFDMPEELARQILSKIYGPEYESRIG